MQKARYKAFISYSHRDDKWAGWLHHALETYRPPKRLVGQKTERGIVPKRLAPIFRDRDELATATDLGAVINDALDRSDCQIVVCSPAAARSKWVNEEVLAYKRLGREDHIFCLIVGGEPNASDSPDTAEEECFPPALRYKLDESGELSNQRTEPIAADARDNKDGRSNAKIKLIAGMLGVGYDALKQRELHRRQRRMVAIVAASVTGMIITTGLAVSALLSRSEAIQQTARAQAEAETARQTTNFLVGLFQVSDPSEALGNTITAREILDKGAERIKRQLASQPAIQATLMQTMGKVYTSLGLYKPAVSLLESALKERQGLYGDMDLKVAQSLDQLAQVLKLKADYKQAEKMYRSALAIRRERLGEKNADVASTEYELADMFEHEGDYEKAEPIFRHTLALRRQLFGDDSPEVAESTEGLAINLYHQGNYDDSVALQRRAVALQRKLHKGPHPDLAEAINNLGFVLDGTGKHQEAERLFREALAMNRKLLGKEHPEVAMGINNVAFALQEEGKYDEAEVMYQKAIAMQRKLLGKDHPAVALSLNNLAFLLHDKGDTKGALAMMRESLDIYRRSVGDESPAVARAMATLGGWMTESGDYKSAETLLRQSLKLREKLLGPEHPAVAASMTVLANLLVNTGRYDEAKTLASKAVSIFTKALGKDHWRTAAATSTEGGALVGLRRYKQAESLLQQSFAVLRNDKAAPQFYVKNATRWMARLYSGLGKPDEAAKYVAMLTGDTNRRP